MFRFWAHESRGNERPDSQSAASVSSVTSDDTLQTTFSQSPKRRRISRDDTETSLTAPPSSTGTKLDGVDLEQDENEMPLRSTSALPGYATDRVERIRDTIKHQFGVEILMKHDELRLINQELAKCQAALEQLRRCHLIPYPQDCPTPTQMVENINGKGGALRSQFSDSIPRWAPPFGVVEGPYARHYAKWLIPDPSFDGMQPEWQFTAEATRARLPVSMDGRSTRHSFGDPVAAVKGRTNRSMSGQKLQSLASGYPQPKDKAGPCILKRSDGQTVKLVCLDCNRENFSSTQGFINHCRIAHKRDFKSHDEAALQSGQVIDTVATSGGTPLVDDKLKSSVPAQGAGPFTGGTTTPLFTSNHVHPLVRSGEESQDVFSALQSRIADSLKLYRQGKLPGVTEIPLAQRVATKSSKAGNFDAAVETPYLSRLMKKRNFDGSLRNIVADARTKVSLDDITPGEESEDSDAFGSPSTARAVVQRVPASSTKPAVGEQKTHPAAGIKSASSTASYASPPASVSGFTPKDGSVLMSDDDADMDENLSPNTFASNNAPSLVSDDGEYDDSDDGSVSGSDGISAESESDVAEITLDDDQEPRHLRRRSTNTKSLRFEKEEPKQVTFISPLKKGGRRMRH